MQPLVRMPYEPAPVTPLSAEGVLDQVDSLSIYERAAGLKTPDFPISTDQNGWPTVEIPGEGGLQKFSAPNLPS